MVYKIGLVSTHGTGKTTLGAIVEGQLKSREIEAIFLREISTDAARRGLPINEATTLTTQRWILFSQIARELEYTERKTHGPNYDVLICDRGPDNYCYLKRKFGDDEDALRTILSHVEKYPYSRIYLLPIVEEAIVAGGGVRSLNREFQLEMDREIRDFLKKHRLEHVELPKPLPDDPFRNEWGKIVVNNTLRDLGKPENFFVR